MELYLITGFLGAGKTTFLKKFMGAFASKRLHLIINEFGKTGVDGTLLQEMNTTLAEINNGSIFCVCRLDKFEEALRHAVLAKPDVILVEASGLADPTGIRKVLAMPAFFEIEYKGSICLVDAMRFEKVLHTARACPKQLAVSSLALVNKADLATQEQLAQVIQSIHQVNPAIAVEITEFGDFQPSWLLKICPQPTLADDSHGADITLQRACVHITPHMPIAQLRSFLTMLAEDTYRIKGFASLEDGCFLVDCVGPMVSAKPYEGALNESPNYLVALAGKGMPLRKALKEATQWYKEYIVEVLQ